MGKSEHSLHGLRHVARRTAQPAFLLAGAEAAHQSQRAQDRSGRPCFNPTSGQRIAKKLLSDELAPVAVFQNLSEGSGQRKLALLARKIYAAWLPLISDPGIVPVGWRTAFTYNF